MSEQPRQLTDDEIITMANALKRLKPGFLPYPIFQEVARLVALPIFELVPVRRSANDSVEVLLTQREAADPL